MSGGKQGRERERVKLSERNGASVRRVSSIKYFQVDWLFNNNPYITALLHSRF